MPRTRKPKRRDLFGELMEGVSAMRAHREGRITLRSHQVRRLALPRKDVVDYTPSRAERRDVEACDPRSERRILGVGSQVVRLQQGCWSEWLVVADAFEWSVADKFELEFPNARRLSRVGAGSPFWITGEMLRLRGNRETTVTVRRRQ